MLCFSLDIRFFEAFRLTLVKKNRQNGECKKNMIWFKKIISFILVLAGKAACWKYVCIGLEPKICIVGKIFKYGELFLNFVVFGGYKH